MKPVQYYLVNTFPKPPVGGSLRNQVQLTFSGEEEDVETIVTFEACRYQGELDLLRIKSEIRFQTFGFIKALVNAKRQKIDFREYLQPVDFPAYYDEGKKLVIFQAPKKVCRGVLQHLRANPCGFELAEFEVDFAKVLQLNAEYVGAWFKRVSSRVSAAGLSGNQIQDDTLFKSLQQVAALSNVTIPWVYDGLEHPVMITKRGGVVLVQNYEEIGLELDLVTDVQERLLSRVWHEKKNSREDADDLRAET
jgi:hypothetical protein